MKISRNLILTVVSVLIATLLNYSCGEKANANMPEAKTLSGLKSKEKLKKPLSSDFKSYWYAGDAEITSYSLEQARYGELREGNAVLVYVTEPFLAEEQVKANGNNPSNIPILKLNSTKNYLTGIYPYSIMSSTFYPVHDYQHAVKVSNSIQEWCGHVYSQINNREQFEFTSHSYFEGEADQNLALPKNVLENEIWNKLRVDPNDLPTGHIEVIPSLEFIRTAHIPMQAYKATATLKESAGVSTYILDYQDINRSLSIQFNSDFPYVIEGWTESFTSGYGANAKQLISTAKKKNQIKTPYWRLNKNKDLIYRDSLGL